MRSSQRSIAALLALAVAGMVGCGEADLGNAPDVQGLTLDTAKQQLKAAGYSADVSDDAMFGVIIESHFTVCDVGSPQGQIVPLEVSKDC